MNRVTLIIYTLKIVREVMNSQGKILEKHKKLPIINSTN